MINKIQNINSIVVNNKISKRNYAAHQFNDNTQLERDTFHRNISFKGV